VSGGIDDLKKLLESMASAKMNVNVGPGLSGFMGFSSTDEMTKYSNDMKEMLTKDVEELAAQEDASKITTLEVRGRKMVIPEAGPRRQNAVLFACLYAIRNPEVDIILRTLDAKAYFLAKDGSVTLAKLVLDEPKAQPVQEPEAPAKLGGRNILIGEEAQKACLVGIRGIDGKFQRIGVPVGSAQDGGISVKLAGGEVVAVPKELVVWITDEKQLLEITSEISKAKQ
jgi:hypothetical protein